MQAVWSGTLVIARLVALPLALSCPPLLVLLWLRSREAQPVLLPGGQEVSLGEWCRLVREADEQRDREERPEPVQGEVLDRWQDSYPISNPVSLAELERLRALAQRRLGPRA